MIFAHYLKIGLRNLKRTKLFTIINILGLAVGMTTCLLILHYVNFERSYDRFHKDSERIYCLRYERTSEEGNAVRFASCCPPAADAIRGVFREVETIAAYSGTKPYRTIDFQKYFGVVQAGIINILKFYG